MNRSFILIAVALMHLGCSSAESDKVQYLQSKLVEVDRSELPKRVRDLLDHLENDEIDSLLISKEQQGSPWRLVALESHFDDMLLLKYASKGTLEEMMLQWTESEGWSAFSRKSNSHDLKQKYMDTGGVSHDIVYIGEGPLADVNMDDHLSPEAFERFKLLKDGDGSAN